MMQHGSTLLFPPLFPSSAAAKRFSAFFYLDAALTDQYLLVMTDYAGEQAMELEAVEAIFMDDLQIFDGMLPDSWAAVGSSYKLTIDPTDEGDDPPPPEEEKLAELIFAHSAEYPGKPPLHGVSTLTPMHGCPQCPCNVPSHRHGAMPSVASGTRPQRR